MPSALHTLPRRQLFAIADAAAVQIRCTGGALWLTLDDDPRDVILEAGQTYSTPEHRRALLYALEPASFALLAPRDAAVPQVCPAAA